MNQLTCQRNCAFILCCVTPFQHSYIRVHRERLGRVFQRNLIIISEQLFVDVGMSLELNSTLIIVVQEDFNSTELFVGNSQRKQSGKFECLQPTVATQANSQLVFNAQVNTTNKQNISYHRRFSKNEPTYSSVGTSLLGRIGAEDEDDEFTVGVKLVTFSPSLFS